ncbi:uncharacterized protein [Macrobrachium rosenbergii]|uniref:uncharacterized protein n=1 Tax=Macrobrachium rosenbergii TaxID=79674 RepID=UPI0034D5671B
MRYCTSGPSSGMPDHQSLPVPLASSEPPQELGPVPDPDLETDPPPGDPGPICALILVTREPPTPDTSSSPNPSPEDEALVDQTDTLSLEDQELASPDTEVEMALALVVAAARVGSPPVASEVIPDFEPASPSGLSPESVPSSPPRTDIDRPWRNPKKKKGRREPSSCKSHKLILELVPS